MGDMQFNPIQKAILSGFLERLRTIPAASAYAQFLRYLANGNRSRALYFRPLSRRTGKKHGGLLIPI